MGHCLPIEPIWRLCTLQVYVPGHPSLLPLCLFQGDLGQNVSTQEFESLEPRLCKNMNVPSYFALADFSLEGPRVQVLIFLDLFKNIYSKRLSDVSKLIPPKHFNWNEPNWNRLKRLWLQDCRYFLCASVHWVLPEGWSEDNHNGGAASGGETHTYCLHSSPSINSHGVDSRQEIFISLPRAIRALQGVLLFRHASVSSTYQKIRKN